MWEETLVFTVHMPDLALVRFLVWDHDPIGQDFIGQRTIAFNSMMPGEKHHTVTTRDYFHSNSLSFMLLVHVEVLLLRNGLFSISLTGFSYWTSPLVLSFPQALGLPGRHVSYCRC